MRAADAAVDADYDAWLSALTLDELQLRLGAQGVTRVVMKRLSPKQDNSKNQIYWQGDLTKFPLPLGDFEEWRSTSAKPKGGDLTFKARLDFSWLTPAGTCRAPNAQLIHYPQYPESRLGSLLSGAQTAPRSLLASRESTVAGRLLLLGVAGEQIVAVALPPGSPATVQLLRLFGEDVFALWPLAPSETPFSAEELLAALAAVHRRGPVRGCRMKGGLVVPSNDPNAAGTTLETLLGILPNSRDEPDFHGWELKTHRDAKVTLMTPAPTGGAIRTLPAAEFMRRYGWVNASGARWDFNGAHRATQAPGGKATTRMEVSATRVELIHRATGEVAMSWRVADLLTHWSRKHSLAAYVRRTGTAGAGFTFGPYVQLGQGIRWDWFQQALKNGTVVVDPAYNMVDGASNMTKARAQFRCYSHELAALYPDVSGHDLRHSPLIDVTRGSASPTRGSEH